jgi:hypothetical protein
MTLSRLAKLVCVMALVSLGVMFMAYAAWFMWVAFWLGSVFDMVHLKDLNLVAAFQIGGIAALGFGTVWSGFMLALRRAKAPSPT